MKFMITLNFPEGKVTPNTKGGFSAVDDGADVSGCSNGMRFDSHFAANVYALNICGKYGYDIVKVCK